MGLFTRKETILTRSLKANLVLAEAEIKGLKRFKRGVNQACLESDRKQRAKKLKKRINQLKEHFEVGGTFTYLGQELIVKSLTGRERDWSSRGCRDVAMLQCEYVDKKGRFHNKTFSFKEAMNSV